MKKGNVIILGLILFTILVGNVSAALWTTNQSGQVQIDFAPNSDVYIHGTEFKPNTEVWMQIFKPNDRLEFFNFYSDSNGEFVYVYDLNGLHGWYQMYATDGDHVEIEFFSDDTEDYGTLQDCKDAIRLGLFDHHISESGGRARLTNNANKTFQVGLASYKKFSENLSSQNLYDYVYVNISANSTVIMQVDVPDCKYQIDLFCGEVVGPGSKVGYSATKRLIHARHLGGSQYCQRCPDEDNDGVCDEDDNCPDSKPGQEVDQNGCDIFQFCSMFSCGYDCLEADWNNDESNTNRPRDCGVILRLSNGIHQQPICVPRIENYCPI